MLNTSLNTIAGRIGSEPARQGELAVTVFNPNAWERTGMATTGRIYPIRANTQDIVLRDRTGRVVPSQITKSEKNDAGSLIVADLAFLATDVPSVGYDTFYLDFLPKAAPPPATDLRIDEQRLALENEFVKVRLSPKFGAIISLVDKRTGHEMLDAEKGAFPIFKGTPNQDYELYREEVARKYGSHGATIPPSYDSSKSEAFYEATASSGDAPPQTNRGSWIRWIEKGPVRAAVRTHHAWRFLKFETYVTLCAGLPWVEVTSRVLAEIPPATDVFGADQRFPAEIQQGYWLTFAPGFHPASVIRDFPLGVEPSERSYFQGRTFVDLVGEGTGLLLLHPGTQYFRHDANGVFSNLIMREWESYFSHEYGWPRYSEYHHALAPHDGNITHADRVRAAEAFSQKLITVLGKRGGGSLPPRKSFVRVEPKNLQVLAFRKKDGPGFEIRVVEVEGKQGPASIKIDAPSAHGSETNLLGKKIANVDCKAGKMNFEYKPWRVQTFEVV